MCALYFAHWCLVHVQAFGQLTPEGKKKATRGRTASKQETWGLVWEMCILKWVSHIKKEKTFYRSIKFI